MNSRGIHVFTSESVTEGHPDKVCDQISDAVLDAVIADDKKGRVACETFITVGLVVVGGELTTKCWVDVGDLVRSLIRDIGYTDAKYGFNFATCGILNAIGRQSPDIAQGVDTGGAGDQGLMVGYACDETAELMPTPITLAHKLTRRLAEVRRSSLLPYLGPDGKSQVTVEYREGRPHRIDTVVISSQHTEDILDATGDRITDAARTEIIEKVGLAVLPEGAGRREDALPGQPDRQVRHRRAAVGHRHDRAQDHRRHLRRLGAPRRRRVLRQGPDQGRPLCHLHGAPRRQEHRRRRASPKQALVQLAYAIGVADPVSIMVDTFGSGVIPDERLTTVIREVFPLTPRGIIKELDLLRPIYRATASYGHFGRTEPEFTWESLHHVAALKAAAAKLA